MMERIDVLPEPLRPMSSTFFFIAPHAAWARLLESRGRQPAADREPLTRQPPAGRARVANSRGPPGCLRDQVKLAADITPSRGAGRANRTPEKRAAAAHGLPLRLCKAARQFVGWTDSRLQQGVARDYIYIYLSIYLYKSELGTASIAVGPRSRFNEMRALLAIAATAALSAIVASAAEAPPI